MTRAAPFLILAIVVTGVTSARPAQACASCACGDNTLTGMGTETAFAGRRRAAFVLQYRAETQNDGPLSGRADAFESALILSYAPLAGVTFSAQASVGARRYQSVYGKTHQTLGLGDATLSARAVLYQDRAAAWRPTVWLTSNLVLPSPFSLRDAKDALRPAQAQPSAGSFRFEPGVQVRIGRAPLSGFASARAQVSTPSPYTRSGPGAFFSAFGLFQPIDMLALGFGPEGRVVLDAQTPLSPERVESLLFASSQLVVSPYTDVLIALTVRIPLFERFPGAHDSDISTRSLPHFTLGVIYDF